MGEIADDAKARNTATKLSSADCVSDTFARTPGLGTLLKRLIGRHRAGLILGLSLASVLVAAIGLARHGYFDWHGLAAKKDAFSALSSIATVTVIVVGSIVSYYRFFRGRTFSLKADLSIDAEIIEAPGDRNLHAISITMKNIGTIPIWNPEPDLTVELVKDGKNISYKIVDWIKESHPDGIERDAIIDAGENISFFVRHMVPKEAWVATYLVYVTSDQGDTWFHAKSFANRASHRGSESE